MINYLKSSRNSYDLSVLRHAISALVKFTSKKRWMQITVKLNYLILLNGLLQTCYRNDIQKITVSIPWAGIRLILPISVTPKHSSYCNQHKISTDIRETHGSRKGQQCTQDLLTVLEEAISLFVG